MLSSIIWSLEVTAPVSVTRKKLEKLKINYLSWTLWKSEVIGLSMEGQAHRERESN